MRDPARIEPILELLMEYWKRDPDYRLGQLICVISKRSGGDGDPFNMEDSRLEKFLYESLYE